MTLGIFSSDFGHSSSKRFPTKWLFPAVTSPIQTVIVKLKSAWPSRRRAARESAANVLKWSLPTLRTLCIWHLQYLQSFRNGCLFGTYWLIRNLNCANSHHDSYGERCSNHHLRHCAQCVSEIYSVLKLFETAVCFAHFGIFEISTAVRRIMLTIPNIV